MPQITQKLYTWSFESRTLKYMGKETEALFRENGFSQTDLVKDFYDKNRFVFYMR